MGARQRRGTSSSASCRPVPTPPPQALGTAAGTLLLLHPRGSAQHPRELLGRRGDSGQPDISWKNCPVTLGQP